MMQSWSCGCSDWSDHYDVGSNKCSSYPACAKGDEDRKQAEESKKRMVVLDRKRRREKKIRERAMRKLTAAEKRVLHDVLCNNCKKHWPKTWEECNMPMFVVGR